MAQYVPALGESVHSKQRSDDGLPTELRAEFRWELRGGCSLSNLFLFLGDFAIHAHFGVTLSRVEALLHGKLRCRIAHIEPTGYHVGHEAGSIFAEEFDFAIQTFDSDIQWLQFLLDAPSNHDLMV